MGFLRMFDRWNRKFMDADAGGGGGGSDPNAGGNGGDNSKPAGGNEPDANPNPQTVTMTQDELNALMGTRAKQAERNATAKLAKELGFESVEAMQAAAKAAKEAEDKNKSEAEKLREALEAEKNKASQAAERAKNALIKAAFAEQAIAANLVSVDDAFVLADLSEVEVSDDGKVTGVKEAVKTLVKDKPYLVKQAGGSGSGGGNPVRGNQPIEDDAEKGRQAALRRNQQQSAGAAGFDPWGSQGGAGGGGSNPPDIAQAVAAAVAAALKGNQQ